MLSSLLVVKSDSDTRRIPDGRLSELRLMRSFSINLPMVTYSWGSTTKPAFCDWKKFMTSSNARAASSCDGVIGDESAEEPLSSLSPDVVAGSGGGCIVVRTCVGDRDIVSSMTGNEPGISDMGESSALVLIYFGVSASEDPGGDMYCSTPTSIGKV